MEHGPEAGLAAMAHFCRRRRLPACRSLAHPYPGATHALPAHALAPPCCSKIFASLLAGCFAGILGITGYKGFAVYLLAHALMAGLLYVKASFQPQHFFPSS